MSELKTHLVAGRITLQYPNETIEELNAVLRSKKLEKRISHREKTSLLNLLRLTGIQISVVSDLVLCRDPNNDIFLNLAFDGTAKFLVTRDKDLLQISEPMPFRSVTPAQFLDCVRVNCSNAIYW